MASVKAYTTKTTITASLIRLRISLSPSHRMLSSVRTSPLLLAQTEPADAEQDGDAAGEEDDVDHHEVRSQALGVRAQAGVHVVGRRPDRPDPEGVPLQRRDGLQEAGELDGGGDGEDGRDEH